MTQKQHKIPVILYESEEQNIPYIEIQEDEEMPKALFIQEFKHTGEFEPDSSGNDAPIVDMRVRMYIDMEHLSVKLTPERYDEVRVAVGLKPLQEAKEEGQKILDKVMGNVNSQVQDTLDQKKKVKEELNKRLNERLADKFFGQSEDETEQQDNFKLQFSIVDDNEDK